MSVQVFVRLYDKVPDKNEEEDCLCLTKDHIFFPVKNNQNVDRNNDQCVQHVRIQERGR